MARTKNTPANDVAAQLAELQAQLATLAAAIPAHEEVGVVVEAPAKPKRNTARTKAPAAKAPAKRKTTRTKGYTLTCGDAWLALGADEDYRPRDETRPATAAQLWRLNADGRLAEILAQ